MDSTKEEEEEGELCLLRKRSIKIHKLPLSSPTSPSHPTQTPILIDIPPSRSITRPPNIEHIPPCCTTSRTHTPCLEIQIPGHGPPIPNTPGPHPPVARFQTARPVLPCCTAAGGGYPVLSCLFVNRESRIARAGSRVHGGGSSLTQARGAV